MKSVLIKFEARTQKRIRIMQKKKPQKNPERFLRGHKNGMNAKHKIQCYENKGFLLQNGSHWERGWGAGCIISMTTRGHYDHQVAGGTEQPSSKHRLFCLRYLLFRWSVIYFIQYQLLCSLCRNLIVY